MSQRNEIIEMLSLEDKSEIESLFNRAYQVKLDNVGNIVYFRGIIEVSNYCNKNCYYCGIRKGNRKVLRYDMDDEEIISAALWAYENNYGSVVLQSGERSDVNFTQRITNLLEIMHKKTNGSLGVTLSLGEQSKETYRNWFLAGAHRYLLRIETSNENLYKKFHPEHHSYQRRLECLMSLKEIGYQVGSGVLIGLPYQTVEDLTDDIIFFKAFDVDMIGMGPFVLHQDTPLADKADYISKEKNLQLALKMIAVTRIMMRDINIASTTALEALDVQGRELGLKAGANIVMPVITDIKYRSYYQLYDGKPSLDENANECRIILENKIKAIGEKIGYSKWGDSPHYIKKKDNYGKH